MEVKATIINMPESKMQTMEFEEWKNKIIEGWGGADYKLNRESIVEDIEKINNKSNARVYAHGIVIPYIREADVDMDPRYDEEYYSTPEEQAEMYIFDNGEIYYVHKGFNKNYGWTLITGDRSKGENEFDISRTTEILESKLGKELNVEKESNNFINKIKSTTKEEQKKKKKEAIINGVKKALAEGKYTEKVNMFDPETNMIVEQGQKRII